MTGPEKQRIVQSVREFARGGSYPGGAEQLQRDITALILAGEFDEVIAELIELGAVQGGDKPLVIAEHYRSGNGRYALRWPVAFPLPIPFDQLDRPTQFSVLFGEWSRREMESSYALLNGDTAAAMAGYQECLERASQIDVPELIARSHRGIARVASKTNQRTLEREHLQLAIAARTR